MTSQVPILHQPIYIQPEEKKEKSAPGASLYDDIYNGYRTFAEVAYLMWIDPLRYHTKYVPIPLTYATGAVIGIGRGLWLWYRDGAPKKIDKDGEVKDFGATVHSKGLTSIGTILGKKFFFGIMPLAHFDYLARCFFDSKEITPLSIGVKLGFIAMKAAQITNELIQRIANFVDVPAK